MFDLFLDCMFEHKSASGQNTRCERCNRGDSSFTCEMPRISYGETNVGVPYKQNQSSIYDEWCQEIGPYSFGTILSTQRIELIKGALYWCSGFDDDAYKWCDSSDGYWKDDTLYGEVSAERIVRLTCFKGEKIGLRLNDRLVLLFVGRQ